MNQPTRDVVELFVSYERGVAHWPAHYERGVACISLECGLQAAACLSQADELGKLVRDGVLGLE